MKKIKFLFLGLVSFLLLGSSCSDEAEMEDDLKTDVSGDNHDNHEEHGICTFDFVSEELLNESNSSTKAALYKGSKWKPGETIRIKFLNGDAYVQSKVKQYANEWLKYANLKFVFVPYNENADIKIAFNWEGDTGSWSYLGSICKSIPQDQPSMHFGWLTSSTQEESFSRVILHEFGHALGLEHEHQHPLNPIQWNKPFIYAWFYNWSTEEVDRNFFDKLSTTSTNYSDYDRYSIMHYDIPSYYTLDGYTVGWNTVLSTVDKQFMSNEYPHFTSAKSFPADYDGDGKADLAYMINYGVWYFDYAANGFGKWDVSCSRGDIDMIPLPGDYDGDGKADLAFAEKRYGALYIDYAKNGFGNWDDSIYEYGAIDTKPVIADYDGDGKIDIAFYQTNTGKWFIDYAKNGLCSVDLVTSAYRGIDAIPVPADYDGDGKADLAIKTPTGEWYIDYTKNGFGWFDAVHYGTYELGDAMAAPGDYDGDGKIDIAYLTKAGKWCIDYAKNGLGGDDAIYSVGIDGIPAVADYDGDGKADVSVQIGNKWYVDYAKNGFGSWDWQHAY